MSINVERLIRGAALGSLIVIGITQIGCSGMATANQDFVLAGNAQGIHAFADTLNGVIRTGKETNTDESRYFNTREVQEKEKTKRETSPGWLGKLFAAPTTSTTGSAQQGN